VLLTPVALLALVALATGVALADAADSGDADLTMLLTAVLVLLALAAASLVRARSAVPLRPDLHAWLRRQAGSTGEPVGRLADRCVASYRAGLTSTPPTGADGPAQR
jgi:hypothetical protein